MRKYCLILIFFFQLFPVKAQELILPEGFPPFTIDQFDNPSEGYLFVSPQVMSGNKPGYLVIMDNFGTPVFYQKTGFKTYCFQPYPNGYLAYFEGSVLKYVMLDSTYTPIDTMSCLNCDRFDLHEIRIKENGNYLLAGKKFRVVDMSLIVPGGNPAATIEDYLIQEFDKNHNLLFEWNTRDNYEITDVNDIVDLTASVIDITNFNAIEMDSDTSLLLSMAHQDEITKIDIRTGAIIWRLGGKNNEFTFINSTRPFTRQHHIRKLPNGNITIYDNGTFSDPPYSRGVEYELDEVNKTVTQVWEYDRGKNVFSTHKGNVQRLENGNTLIAWGGLGSNPAVPSFTEVRPDGSVALEVSYPGHDGSYRVFKYPWKTSLFDPSTEKIQFGNWDGYTESLYLLGIRNNADTAMAMSGYSVHSPHFFINETFPVSIAPGEEKFFQVIFFPSTAEEGDTLNDILTIYADRGSILRIGIQVELTGVYPDMTPPALSFVPEADSIPNDSVFQVVFSEPVRNLDDSELENSDLGSVITLRKQNETGEVVSYNAFINAEKTSIEVSPSANLENGMYYYIAVEPSVEDYAGNKVSKTSKTYRAFSPVSAFIPEEDMIRIFPNPAGDMVYIQTGSSAEIVVYLYDYLGKSLIMSSKPGAYNPVEVDLSGIPPGLYLLKIYVAGDKEMAKWLFRK